MARPEVVQINPQLNDFRDTCTGIFNAIEAKEFFDYDTLVPQCQKLSRQLYLTSIRSKNPSLTTGGAESIIDTEIWTAIVELKDKMEVLKDRSSEAVLMQVNYDLVSLAAHPNEIGSNSEFLGPFLKVLSPHYE